MSIKLGEMLMEAGLLTRPQLEAALKNQVIFGGKLGTNLIELRYLTEDDLARFLSKKLELPCATSEQLSSIPPDIIELIPKEVADKYKVIPLGRERKRLTLAMLDPADLSVIDAISFVTGFYINPLIAPELRLAVALENYYGIKREVRYIQLSEKGDERPSFVKIDDSVDMGGKEADMFDFSLPQNEEIIDVIDVHEVIEAAVEPVIIEPVISEPVESESLSSEPINIDLIITEPALTVTLQAEPVATEPVTPEQYEDELFKADFFVTESEETEPVEAEPVEAEPFVSEAVQAEPVYEEPVKEEPVAPEPVEAEPVESEPFVPEPVKEEPVRAEPEVTQPSSGAPLAQSIESFAEELVEAKGREDIAEIITSFLGQEFNRVVLFMIKGTVVDGWKGMQNNYPIPAIEDLRVQLDEPSVLKVVNEGRSFYLGPIPDTPANAQMLAAFGAGAPSSALLIPLLMVGRVVAIVYVDDGNKPVENRLAFLQKIVGKATIAFEILILKNKIMMT